MNTYPSISLVTLCLNNGTTLRRTLESVKAQTVRLHEHIIIDGFSDDDSMDICREYQKEVSYPVHLIQTPPKGVYDALNRGLSECTGDVAGLLHAADTFASSDVLERMAAAFARDPELELTYADIVFVNADGQRGRYYSAKRFQPRWLKWGFAFPHPSMYVRRELFSRFGLYRTDMIVAGDFEWIVRAVLNGGVRHRYIPMCVVEMSKGGLSTDRRNILSRNPREKLQALRINGHRVCPLRLALRYLFALISVFEKR